MISFIDKFSVIYFWSFNLNNISIIFAQLLALLKLHRVEYHNHEVIGNNMEEKIFLNQNELASRWGMSPRTLENWRSTGKGPAYVKIGGQVRYKFEDIKKLEETSQVGE